MNTSNISKRFNIKLLLLIVFQCAFFLLYQNLNRAYQTWDSAGHIALSFRMADEIKDVYNKTPGSSLVNLIKISNYYPPFIQLLGAVFSLTFGYSSENMLFITLFFFILTIIFTYKLALYLSKNENLAFYTTLIFSFFPEVIEQSRVLHLDLPLVALLLVAIYFLLTSELFSKRKSTFLFFLFAGLAQNTKWYGVVYLLLPFLYVFVAFIVKAVKRQISIKKSVINLFIGAVEVFALCFPWYFYNYTDLIKFSKIFSTAESDDPTGLFSLANLFFYPASILTYQTLFLPFLCMIFGIVLMLFKDRRQFSYLVSYLLISPLVFLIIANKNLRRLRTIKGKLRGKTKTDKSAVQTIRGSSLVNLFLEVPGKTATVSLTEIAEPRTLALINCADRIYLKPKKHQITLNSDDGTYLGKLPDILAARLIKLIKGGNQYEAYVKGVTDEQIKVFLKEVKRAKRLVNVNSFPIDDRTLYVAFTPPDLVHGEMPESRTLEDQAEDGSEDDESGSNRED